MQFETTVQVDTSAGQLWRAVAEVENWPEWTPTFNEVIWLTRPAAAAAVSADGIASAASLAGARSLAGAGGLAADDKLRPGARARIRQPGLPRQIWEVTEVRPGTSFTWQTSSPGTTIVGTHQVSALAANRAQLTIGLSLTGPLAPVVGVLVRARAARNLQHEAAGLKRCAEVTASTQRRA